MARNGPGLAVGTELADTGTNDQRTHEGGHATSHVHQTGTGEVLESTLGEPAAAPLPANNDRVDQTGDEDGVHDVGSKLRPLSNRTSHDGGRRCGECSLEEEVSGHAQRVEVLTQIRKRWQRVHEARHAEPGETEPAATTAAGVGNTPADQGEHEHTEGGIEQALHHHVG